MTGTNKYFKILIGLLLALVWIGFVVYQSYQIENVFTVLTREYSKNTVNVLPKGEIYQGTKIVGEFKATENYLGIIGFRFWTFYRLNDDYMIFRIREKKSLDWYYQNKYKADQFQPDQYFTFGFPAIIDSKNKTYIFEIESFQGRPGVAVRVSDLDPVFVAKYKYPRDLVSSSVSKFISFGSYKLANLVTRAEFKASSFIYLIPFLLFLLSLTPAYLSFEKNIRLFIRERSEFTSQLLAQTKIKPTNTIDVIITLMVKFIFDQYRQTKTILDKFKLLLNAIFSPIILTVLLVFFLLVKRPDISSIFIMIAGSVLDSIFIRSGDITMLILTILWVCVIYRYQTKDLVIFVLAMVFLIGSVGFYFLNWTFVLERSTAWAWIFLTITVIMNIIKSRAQANTVD